MRRSAIGLDVCGRWTGAAQISVHRGRARIDAAACVPRSRPAEGPPDAQEMARVADVLERRGFHGRGVVTAAPDDRLIVGVLELPARSGGVPLEQIARVELSRTHKRDPDSMEVALWDLASAPRPAAHVGGAPLALYMAAALPHADADVLLKALEAPGLCVRAIDARAWAMARACEPLLTPAPWALLDLGEAASLLAVVTGGVVVFQRVLPDAGVERMRGAMTGPLGMTPDVAEFVIRGGPADTGSVPEAARALIESQAEEIARELRPALEYTAGSPGAGSVEGLLLMGAGARVPGVAARLGDSLGIPVRVVTPADVADCPAGHADSVGDPRLTVAVGLARHEEGR